MLKKLKIVLASLAISFALVGIAVAATTSYVVKPGDTLCKIGKQFGIPCNIMVDNFPPGLNPNLIHPGDGLVFNTPEPGSEVLGGLVSKPYTFSPNTVISSAQINANYDTLYTLVNGNLSNANINASAAISSTKINGTAIVSTGATSQSINGTTTIFGGLFVSTTSNVFRVPVMTTAQRDALGSVDAGSIVYLSDGGQFSVREGGSWVAISPAAETALASTATKGIVELATNSEVELGTANGATGAALVITPAQWLEYSDTHWSTNLPVGENVTAYNVLYMSSTGSYYIAHANVQAEVDRVAGVVFETVTASNYPRVYFPGSIIYSTSGMATGSPVYLSDTGTASTTAGTIRKVLGIALGTNVWQFNPTVSTPTSTAGTAFTPIMTGSNGSLTTTILTTSTPARSVLRSFATGATWDTLKTYSNHFSFSASGALTSTIGFEPRTITFQCSGQSGAGAWNTSLTSGYWTASGTQHVIGTIGSAGSTATDIDSDTIIGINQGGGGASTNIIQVTVSATSTSGFTLTATKSFSPGPIYCNYTAYEF